MVSKVDFLRLFVMPARASNNCGLLSNASQNEEEVVQGKCVCERANVCACDVEQVIICPLWPDNRMPILRDPKTCMKWCVRNRDLRGRTHFPQYCAGIGYVISRRLVPMLYNASRSTPFFWIDDVYVTGLLTQKLSVKPTFVDVLSHFSAHDGRAVDQYTNLTQPMTYWYVHAKNENNFWTMWKSLMKRLTAQQRHMISADVVERWSSE